MARHTAGTGAPFEPEEGDRYTNLATGLEWIRLDDQWTPIIPVDPEPTPDPDPTPTPEPKPSSLFELLRDDMALPHQGKLDGVPDNYDWSAKPRVGMGMNTAGMACATAWGEIYSSSNPSKNTLVQVSNLQLWILNADNTWHRWQHTKAAGPTRMDAGFFQSDFQGNVTSPTAPGTLPDGTRTGDPNPKYNLHFFPGSEPQKPGRITLPAGFKAILSCFDARLILKNAAGPDDRSSARFLAGAGGDYWKTLSNPWTGSGSNGDFAIARHRWVTNDWQTFTCYAGSIPSNNLPPITLAQGATPDPVPDPPVDPDPPVPDPGGSWTMPTGTLRIMPVGDSVTALQGQHSTGWATMPARFAAAGLTAITVGSETGRSGIKHQGIGGWCLDNTNGACKHSNGFQADGVVQHIVQWCDTHKPNVIVLIGGGNDTWTKRTGEQAVQALDVCLGLIRDHLPNCMVLVSIQRSWMDVPTLHQPDLGWSLRGMEQVVTAKQASMHVRMFNAYAGFGGQGSNSWRDYVHPSEVGVQTMMDNTYNAVMALRT